MNQNYSRTRIVIGGIVVALVAILIAAACLLFLWLMFEMARTGGGIIPANPLTHSLAPA